MTIRKAQRDALNERLKVVADDSIRSDYTASLTALEPVIAGLRDDARYGGWVVYGWDSGDSLERRDAPLTQWHTGVVFQVRRDYVVKITRDSAHQARAEANGEVKVGDNTYEQVFSELFQVAIGDRLDGDMRNVFVTAIEAIASAIEHVSRLGIRPPRLRDIS